MVRAAPDDHNCRRREGTTMGTLRRTFRPLWKSLFLRPASPTHRRGLRQSRERELFLLQRSARQTTAEDLVPAMAFGRAS